jgi:hypothetical protein
VPVGTTGPWLVTMVTAGALGGVVGLGIERTIATLPRVVVVQAAPQHRVKEHDASHHVRNRPVQDSTSGPFIVFNTIVRSPQTGKSRARLLVAAQGKNTSHDQPTQTQFSNAEPTSQESSN